MPVTTALLAFFTVNGYLTTGATHRIAFGIGSGVTGAPELKTSKALTFAIKDPNGAVEKYTVQSHHKGLPWSYFPFDFAPKIAGTYATTVVIDGAEANASFEVVEHGASPVPGPGDAMPAMATPTTDNLRGIDPLCTNEPMCAMHAVSLDAAMQAKKPVAYLVSTPKFCQSGICGPVLEVMTELSTDPRFADTVTFIHQEVYQSATEAAEKGSNATLSTAVAELELPSEPVLFLIGSDGKIHRRLDAAFDVNEVGRNLTTLLS